jgi:HEAT repeat protein
MRCTAGLLVLLLTIGPASSADLVRGLGDPDPRERKKAVGKLERMSGRRAFSALVTALADEDGGVAERAMRALASRTEPRERSLLASHARRDGREPVRRGAARILAGWGGDEAVAVLSALLADRSARVREISAGGLGEIGGGAQIAALLGVLADRCAAVRVAALTSLDALDPAGSPARAHAFLRDGDPGARVAGILILTERQDDGADAALIAALEDPFWSVKIAAARAVASLRLPGAVPVLIASLERESGRVREEIHRALVTIAGIGLPDDPARWRAWWIREEEGFVPPLGPTARPHSASVSAVSYHSIPVTSRAISFVIDASRSMSNHAKGDSGPTRRELAMAELETTLRRLPRGTRFNLVLFGRETIRWQARARLVSEATIRAALKEVERMTPGGWTDLFGALEAAFEDRTVDTIYLLTDGAPSSGRFTSRTSLLSAVKRLNRCRLVRIHAVGFGTDRIGKRWRGLLFALAKAHDGVHVSR